MNEDKTSINKEIKNIIKSNHFILAQFDMTTYEQKIVLLCISKIPKNSKRTGEFSNIALTFNLTSKEINCFLKLNPKSKSLYSELHNIAERLESHKIYIYENESFTIIRPFPYCQYKNGIFTLRFEQSMEQYLLELKDKFTVYNLNNVVDLKSSYSIRIYEIMKSYEWLGCCNFNIIEFKKIIGVIEIDENENIIKDMYPKYSNLKQRVLTVAQKELAEKTDIKFDFEEIKTGRKVTALKFEIQKNPNSIVEQDPIPHPKKEKEIKIQPNDNEIEEDELMDELRSFIVEPLKTKDLKAILKTAHNDVQLIKNKYELAQRQNNIENLTAWLISAIENDFSEPISRHKKNKFVNYEQDDWDFEKLERLEREYIDKKLGE